MQVSLIQVSEPLNAVTRLCRPITRAGANICVQRLAIACILGLSLFALPSYAAERDPAEVELRLDVGLKVELPADLRLRFTQNIRFDDRIRRFYQLAPELELGYAPLEWLYWGVGYRYSYDLDSQADFQHRHRPYSRLVFPWKLKPVHLIWRMQWQVDLRSETDEEPREIHMLRLRLMTRIAAVPVVTPFVSMELFQRLDASDSAAPLGGVRKLRFLTGFEWIVGGLALNLGYFIEVPTLNARAGFNHAVIIGGTYKLIP